MPEGLKISMGIKMKTLEKNTDFLNNLEVGKDFLRMI